MKVIDLSGRQHTWNLKGYQPTSDDTRPRSSIHLKCRELLKEIFPLDAILEEVPVPGENLFLDFFLPARRMVIEVQGEQHQTFTPFFHKTKTNFYKSVGRDRRKHEWCQANNFKIIEFNYNESESEWRDKVTG